jgi:hypothetical protein
MLLHISKPAGRPWSGLHSPPAEFAIKILTLGLQFDLIFRFARAFHL